MARTQVELWTEGAIVTVVLATFLLTTFPLLVKGESLKATVRSKVEVSDGHL